MMPLMKLIRQKHQSITERVAQLSKETQSFLSTTATDRQAHAEQQATELSQFRQNLFNSVWGKSGQKYRFITNKAAQSKQVINQNISIQETVDLEPSTNTSIAGQVASAEILKVEAIEILSTAVNYLQDEPTVLEVSQDGVVPYEKEIYNYLQQGNNAGLTNIQKALGISQFEAANALRSLVQKGLINKL